MEISITLHTNEDITTSYPVNHDFSQEDMLKSALAMIEQYVLCGKKFTVTSTLKGESGDNNRNNCINEQELQRLLKAARADEREQCALDCEAEAEKWRGEQDVSDFKLCAARIRAAGRSTYNKWLHD